MTRTNDIQQLYIGLLGRAADAGGLNYWANSEYSIDEIAARIVHGADEFPQDDRPALIAQLFDNLFNRTATPEDVAYWEGWLDQYDASLDVLVMNLIRYPSEQDGETLNNRTFVANAYTKAAAGTDKELDLEAAAAVIDDVNHTPLSVSEALATIDGAAGDPTDLLAQLQAATDSRDAAVKAWKEAADLPAAMAVDADFVANAANTTEADLGDFINDNASALGISTTAYNEVEVGLKELGKFDELEDARLNLIKNEIAAKATALNNDVRDKTNDLNQADSGSSLKTHVDAYQRSLADIKSAEGFSFAADKRLDATVADFVANNVAQVVSAAVVPATATAAGVSIVLATDPGTPVLLSYTVGSDPEWNVPSALKDLNLTAIRSDAEAAVVAKSGIESAQEASAQRLVNLTKYDETQTNGTLDSDGDIDTAPTALANEALAYVTAQGDLKDFNELRAEFDEKVADVEGARGAAASIAELDKEAKAAEKELADAGFSVETLEDNAVYFASVEDDVILLGSLAKNGEAATIHDFGFAGNDVIYVGDAYTLNTGKFADDGDNSVLELFLKQTGASTVIQFEVDPFSSATNVNQSFEITLTGVNVEDVAFVDGFISVA